MPDLVKALLSDMISGLSAEELRNVVMKTAENHFEDIGKAALEEKGKRNVDSTKVFAPGFLIQESGAAGVVIVERKEDEAVIEEELQVLAENAASPEDKKRKRKSTQILIQGFEAVY